MSFHVRVGGRPWISGLALLAVVGGDGCGSTSAVAPSSATELPGVVDAGVEAAAAGAASTATGSVFPTVEASACRPGDVQTYQPGPYHFAAAAWRGVCVVEGPTGNGQDRMFFDRCLGPGATPADCDAFQADAANADCAKCILTPDSTTDLSGYGPLIDHGTFITTNVAGCIELTDPGALSCAKAVQALGGCELGACEANCPVDDVASRAAYDACTAQADRGGCQPYAMAAACTNAEVSSAQSCFLRSFDDFYYAVVPLFCGPPPIFDGGNALRFDAGDDGLFGSVAQPDASVGVDLDAAITDLPDGDVRLDGPKASDAATGERRPTDADARDDAPRDAARD